MYRKNTERYDHRRFSFLKKFENTKIERVRRVFFFLKKKKKKKEKKKKVFEQRIIVSLLRKNFKGMAGRSRNPRRPCPKGMTEIGLLRTTFVLAANFILSVFAN